MRIKRPGQGQKQDCRSGRVTGSPDCEWCQARLAYWHPRRAAEPQMISRLPVEFALAAPDHAARSSDSRKQQDVLRSSCPLDQAFFEATIRFAANPRISASKSRETDCMHSICLERPRPCDRQKQCAFV